ncbi:hypothetical protein N9Y42_07975, partial [Mariniblastus sp.]|nr:hypothetical protein [Mariniblastus sp.]
MFSKLRYTSEIVACWMKACLSLVNNSTHHGNRYISKLDKNMLVLRTVVTSLVVWCCAPPLQGLQAQTATVESTAASKSTQVVTDRKDAIHLPTPKTEDAFQFIVYGDRTG